MEKNISGKIAAELATSFWYKSIELTDSSIEVILEMIRPPSHLMIDMKMDDNKLSKLRKRTKNTVGKVLSGTIVTKV